MNEENVCILVIILRQFFALELNKLVAVFFSSPFPTGPKRAWSFRVREAVEKLKTEQSNVRNGEPDLLIYTPSYCPEGFGNLPSETHFIGRRSLKNQVRGKYETG